MPRTRQLHPAFFKHEDLGALSPLHRLLFQGMWCEADREGRLEDRPKRLRATWLPYDNADGDKLVSDLAARGHVVRYEVGGLKLLRIPSFKKWQRVHPSEVPSQLPAPIDDSTRSENSLRPEEDPTPPGVRNPPIPSLPSQSSLPSCEKDSLPAEAGAPVRIYSRWRELWSPKADPKLDDKRKRTIQARLKERTEQQILDSLAGWKNDTWSERPRNSKLGQLLRDAEQIDKGLEWLDAGPPRPAAVPFSVGRAIELPPPKHPPCGVAGCAVPGESRFDGTAIRGCRPHANEWSLFVLKTAGREPDTSDADVLQDWLKAKPQEAACTS